MSTHVMAKCNISRPQLIVFVHLKSDSSVKRDEAVTEYTRQHQRAVNILRRPDTSRTDFNLFHFLVMRQHQRAVNILRRPDTSRTDFNLFHFLVMLLYDLMNVLSFQYQQQQ
ncbi:hypothetical protein INR49_016252 [Caranx melampygus]|nr:hypothetical protein INR49_016252 [Caranx melampygus]